MADAKEPWNEVGDRLSALALKLKLHAKEELSEERKAEARSAVERFGATIQGAIDALGEAVRDPAVKEDAKAAGQALSTAMATTVEEVLRVLRESSPRGAGGAAKSPGDAGDASAGPEGADVPGGTGGAGATAASSGTDETAAAGGAAQPPGTPRTTEAGDTKDE